MAVVDVHAHAVPAGLLEAVAAGRERFPNVEVLPHDGSFRVRFGDAQPTRPVAGGLTDLDARAAWLAAQGVDVQVVGGWLDVLGYDLPAGEGAAWSEALNASLLEVCATSPRLVPLGTVPLQDPARAVEMLTALVAGGCPGVMVATRAGGRELDDPAFTPFFEAADDTGAVVFLHPGFGATSDRYHDYGLVNALARLEDSTVTLARLLYAGIPARYPRMRMVVAHGGGALPYALGRLVRNHQIVGGRLADPVESFAALYFDSVVFDPDALRLLVGKAGAGRVLLGSDYPFPIGDLTPRTVVEQSLETADAAAVLGTAAARVFGIDDRTVAAASGASAGGAAGRDSGAAR